MNAAAPAPPKTVAVWRRRALVAVKFAVVAAILAFVWRTLGVAVADLGDRQLRIEAAPAAASAAVYAAALAVMGLVWRAVLVALGQPAALGPALAAHFLSQLGKYVPGKATLLLVRTERLLGAARRSNHHASVAAIAASVFYEALVFMATGAALSLALLPAAPALGPGWGWLPPALALLMVGFAAPTLPGVFGWLVRRGAKLGRQAPAATPRPPGWLLPLGVGGSLVAWGLQGLALALAARAVGVGAPLTASALPLWTLAMTLPTLAGFLSLLPGGVVVREAASLLVLTPALGEADALAATVAIRLVTVATETLACVSLIAGGLVRRRPRPPRPNCTR